MDASERDARSASFGYVAQQYARSRPEYPPEAVRWLAGSQAARLVDLGAGTGKLTVALLSDGHRVLATDPSRPMLTELVHHVGDEAAELPPGLSCIQARAEALPLADGSVDTVAVAQAFHWFDSERALGEVARVLRPGGAIGLIWNFRDESVPWVRRLSEVIGSEGRHEDPTATLEQSGLFDEVKRNRFRMWQRLNRDDLVALVESRSYVASRPRHERQSIVANVRELYDQAARAPDGLVLPYTTVCYRAQVNALSRRRVDSESLFWS